MQTTLPKTPVTKSIKLKSFCYKNFPINSSRLNTLKLEKIKKIIDYLAATRCAIKLLQSNRKSINLYNLKICDTEQLL